MCYGRKTMMGCGSLASRTVFVVLWTCLQPCIVRDGVAADQAKSATFDELLARDRKLWRDLFQRREFKQLDEIADDLRSQLAKYPNGRGKLWRFAWCPLTPNLGDMSDEEYDNAFRLIDAWKTDRPDSVNALLVEAHVWQKYSFQARGGRIAIETPQQQLDLFQERCEKASAALDRIDSLKLPVDAVYRRLRMEIAKGLGEKTDLELVYEGLRHDPRDMELVHGMAICLLPRWFGEPGELERFAKEVADRTQDDCGDLQYTTAVIAAKEMVKSYLLDTHAFDWPRIRRGFRDLERIYPDSREHWNDEAQLAFMVEDLDVVYEIMAKIGPVLRRKSWEETEINLDKFRERITPEMMAGSQRRQFLGHTHSVMALQTVGEADLLVSVNWGYGIRFHDSATGKRKGWIYLEGLWADTASIHPQTGLMACGFENRPGLLLLDLGRGQSAELQPTPKRIIKAAFSPEGGLLAVGDEAGTVVMINLETGQTERTWEPTTPRQVYGLAFVPGSDHLAMAGSDGRVLLVNHQTGAQVVDRRVADSPLHCLAASKEHIAVGTNKGDVFRLSAESLVEQLSFSSPPWEVITLAFSPEGKTLAFGIRAPHWEQPIENTLYLWHHTLEKAPRPITGHKFGVNRVTFSRDGKSLYSASHDWTIRQSDVARPER